MPSYVYDKCHIVATNVNCEVYAAAGHVVLDTIQAKLVVYVHCH